MSFLLDLWMPILLSAIFVFLVSSIMHMLLPIHKGDYKKLPGEETLLAEMRTHGLQPGEYMFPYACGMKELSSPEMTEKFNKGPVGLLAVMPNGPWAIGKSLVQWFLYSLLMGIFTAYLAALALSPGADYLEVFRVTGTVAVLGYATANVHNSIWKGIRWTTTLKFIFDGVVYGLVTAGTFGWLWPGATP